MADDPLHRSLALMLSLVPPQVGSRLLALLPPALQSAVRARMGSVTDLSDDELTLFEQALKQDLDALFGEDAEEGKEVVREALLLRLSDVLAVLLPMGTAQEAADVVRRLPADVESETLHLIAAQSWRALARRSDPDAFAFLSALGDALGTAGRDANPDFVAEVLRHIQTPVVVRRILTNMYDKDPDSTGRVQDLIYGFSDLVKLSDRELQVVLQGVDHWDLILALRPAPTSLRRRVLANLSKRRAALLQDDETVLEEVDDAQVEMLQHQIVDRARMLYEAGAVLTYMGSIERDEPVEDVPEVVPHAAGHSQVGARAKRREKKGRSYVVGIIAGVLGVGIAISSLIWFSQMKRAGTLSKPVDRAVVGVEEADSNQVRGGAKTGGRQNLSQAAEISGQALLMSGDRVRSASRATAQKGDRVKTGEEERATVRLENDVGQIQLEEDTDVEVLDDEGTLAEAPRLQVRVGNLWVKVKDPSLEVTSPLARVSGAEGAIFQLRVSLNAATTVTVHAGTVWVRTEDELGEDTLVLSAGERIRLLPDGSSQRSLHSEPMDMQAP